ncbi:lipase 1-like [Thrips palmi]|uniref:Lipase 1-like n=1 Tax=Thrips palmi TaxID=161013 RepID=A0A6P8YTJ7_THRPL|nr:lipase 1-like [Thrips palmi]
MHEFWDFSWNENGLIDLPSIIDYVLETTGRDKLMTIGHSMGVTAQVVLMSERPSYADKIICSVVLAPPVFFSTPPAVLATVRRFFQVLPQLKNSIGRNVVNDKLPFTEQCMIPYCFSQSNNKFSDMCRAAIHLLMGKPQKRMDNDYALKMLAHFPGGASIRQVLHYLQVVESARICQAHYKSKGVFKKYDFGSEKNLKLYGSPHSPAYNLSAITTPMHVYYGTSDGLVSPVDAQKFVDTFPSVKEVHILPYNHVDFVLADDVGETLIRPIVKTLLKYI